MAERSFDYLCRVCAANTNHPNAQGISILKTNTLREKIEKHLFLTVTQDDPLPKVLCQNCFRQVEKTASLAQIARHTQEVFKGFLKTAQIAEDQRSLSREVSNAPEYRPIQFGERLNREAALQQHEKSRSHDESTQQRQEIVNKQSQVVATHQYQELPDRFSHDGSIQQLREMVEKPTIDEASHQRKELTKRHGHELSMQQRKDMTERHSHDASFHRRKELHGQTLSMHERKEFGGRQSHEESAKQCKELTERHSHDAMVQQRKEYAERQSHDATMQQRKELAERQSHDATMQQRKELAERHSLDALLNYRKEMAHRHSHDAARQQHKELTDRHSQDAAMQQCEEVVVNVSVNDPLTRETQHKMISASQKSRKSSEGHFAHPSTSKSPRPMTGPATSTDANEAFSKAPESSVINFFRGRVPASTTFTPGDMSLAKVFTGDVQPPSEVAFNARCKRRLNEIKSAMQKPSRSLLKVSHKPSASQPRLELLADELPPQIIIAEPKNRKQDGQRAQKSSKPRSDLRSEQRTAPNAAARAKPDYTEDILLGQVIKDIDLLKLILKALKWPVNSLNLEEQMQRLKNSNFATIMSDPNLLHDNDLTQLLGPYLAPMLLAAQMIQQQQMMAAAAAAAQTCTPAPPPAPVPTPVYDAAPRTVDIASAIPYKLPAETSVQLVPASPEDDERMAASNSMQKPKYQPRVSDPNKVRRTIKRDRDRSVGGVSSQQRVKPRRRSRSAMNYNLDISPSYLVRMTSKEARDYTTAALSKLLDKQRSVIRKATAQPETIIVVPDNDNEDENELEFDTDDIILIEEPSQQPEMPYVCASSTTKENFTAPPAAPLPEITRPIIKRRKTVIQSHPRKIDLTSETPRERTAHAVAFKEVMMQRSLSDSTSADSVASNASTVVPSSADNSTQEEVSSETKANAQETASVRPTTTSTTDVDEPPKPAKKLLTSSRSALGKELLAAIGLQKVSDYDKEDNGATETPTVAESSVGEADVNKIRSALKTSLKKAQDNKRKQLQQQIKKQLNQTLSEHQSRKHTGPIIQDADSTTKHVVKEATSSTTHTSSSAPNVHTDSSSEDVGSDNDTVAVAREKIKQSKNNLAIEAKAEMKESTPLRKLTVRKTPASLAATPSKSLSLLKSRSTLSSATKETKGLPKTEDGSDEIWSVKPTEDTRNSLSLLKNRSTLPAATKQNAVGNDSQHSEIWSIKTVDGLSPVPSGLEAVVPKRRGRKPALEKKSPIRRAIVPGRSTSLASNRVLKAAKSAAARSRAVAKQSVQLMVEVFSENEVVHTQVGASVSPKPSPTTSISTNKNRPSRVSKTMSKYYKGPDKPITARRGAVQTRATRARFI